MEEKPLSALQMREQEYTQALIYTIVGVSFILLALAFLYIIHYAFSGSYKAFAQWGLGIGALMGIVLVALPVGKVVRIRQMKTVNFTCPYCDSVFQLLDDPHSDFDCDICLRRIYFDSGGNPVPVETVSCPHCGAIHRISTRTEHYTCDSCNTVIQFRSEQKSLIDKDEEDEYAVVKQPGVNLGSSNQDLLLRSFPTVNKQSVAELLRKETGVSVEEAGLLLAAANSKTPLVFATDIPNREAMELQHALQMLGAQVETRESVRI